MFINNITNVFYRLAIMFRERQPVKYRGDKFPIEIAGSRGNRAATIQKRLHKHPAIQIKWGITEIFRRQLRGEI